MTAPSARPGAWILTTERLGLRPWAPGDVPLAQRLWGDPEVTRYLHRGPFTEPEIAERLAREDENLRTLGFQYWPVFLREGDAFVGCCGLKACPYEGTPEAPEFELGFHLVPSMWGRGLATEAAAAVVEHAFGHLGMRRLYAGHHPENRASGAVLGKLGFVYFRDVFYEATGLDHPLYVLGRS